MNARPDTTKYPHTTKYVSNTCRSLVRRQLTSAPDSARHMYQFQHLTLSTGLWRWLWQLQRRDGTVGVLGVEVLSQPLKPRCPSDSTLNHTRVPDAKSDSSYLESNTTRTPELMYEDSIFLSEIRPWQAIAFWWSRFFNQNRVINLGFFLSKKE